MLPAISLRDRLLLRVQRQVSYLFFPFVAVVALCWVRMVKRLSLREAAAIRNRFHELVAAGGSPILICSNHLTLVDSVILSWALVPIRSYFRHYAWLPWNVPEKTNFSRTLFWRATSFFSKSVYITRGGPREEIKRSLARISHLLRAGELVSIFPEGGRSRTGRVDTHDFAYGVGQIVQAVPDIQVLCAYLRGRKQNGYSDFPITGDEYIVHLEMFRPGTTLDGLRGARDLATQIVHKLADMEMRYLAGRDGSHLAHGA